MPNNTACNLTITCKKKDKASLKKFVEQAIEHSEAITMKDAKKLKKAYLKDNKDEFRDRIDYYAELTQLPVLEFIKDILYLRVVNKLIYKQYSELSFNKFVPIPKEIEHNTSPTKIISQQDYDLQEKKIAKKDFTKQEEMFFTGGITEEMSKRFIKDFGFDNWYDWNKANYGTKWGAYSIQVNDIGETSADYSFETAWSPAIPFFAKVSLQFPKLQFVMSYKDEGGGFQGTATIQNGVVNDVEEEWEREDEEENEEENEEV